MDIHIFRQQCAQLIEHLSSLNSSCQHFRPTKKSLKWFGKGRLETRVSMLSKGVCDAYNHAAALIGYFQGYEARGRFQDGIPECLHERDIFQVMTHIETMTKSVEQCINNILSKPLVLKADGPSKPGPHRTLEVAIVHMRHIEIQMCTILLGMISKESTKEPIRLRLTAIVGTI